MKIYLLRHGKRKFEDHGFYTPLIPEGEEQARNLVDILDKYEINQIYSSPFIRALQTIKPYADKNKLKIKVENAIYEDIEEPWFLPTEFQYTLSNEEKEKYQVDEKYESYFAIEKIKFNESFEDVQKRSWPFLEYLISKYRYEKDNIVLVTHMSVVNAILSKYESRSKESNFSQGGIIQIYGENQEDKK